MNDKLNSIACIGFSAQTFALLEAQLGKDFHFYSFQTQNELYQNVTEKKQSFRAIISEGDLAGPFGIKLKESLEEAGFGNIPFSVIMQQMQQMDIKKVMDAGVSEVFFQPISAERIGRKIQYLIDQPTIKKKEYATPVHEYKMPLSKRIFDFVLSSIAMLLLSPLFLLVAILLKLESKGPVFYYSLRVGTGYKTFRFYKFRSMFVGADAKLAQLKHLNQYNTEQVQTSAPLNKRCDTCEKLNTACTKPLYADNNMWCEETYKEVQLQSAGQTFVKIKDDPRVTRIGKFIRNTSIDELPQLWNVLKGDMSLVGNRPLPLYEAEKLTTDKYALRFIAPAGITGLWQVSKRGKGAMSEDERISLDNDYAKSFGLFFDIRLILKTIPALFQKENV